MHRIFLYGTLRHMPLLSIVLGRDPGVLQAARLPGFTTLRATDGAYPLIVACAGQVADGLLLDGISDAERDRLDYYELGFGYRLAPQTVDTETGPLTALVYLPDADKAGAQPWSLEIWERDWSALNKVAATEAMGFMGQLSPAQMAARFEVILTRAQARLNAQTIPPTTLRRTAQPGDVVLDAKSIPYAGFFSLEEYTLRHRTHDSGMSMPLQRAAFVAVDAATVLPYDPVRDHVLLIEQFRVGAFGRGDPNPWSLEAIAGRIDPGETPDICARREALEEAGLTLTELIPVGSYYPSPGAKTEFLFSFIGLADLPETAAGLGGLLAEGEDIRAHVISFDRLMDLVASGEAGNAPLILSALHLARLRDGLRAHLP